MDTVANKSGNITTLKQDVSSEKKKIKKSIVANNSTKSEARKVENVFYLEAEVKRKKSENDAMKKSEFERIDKKCAIIEEKDKKYINALKEELLRKYKREQDKSQKKIENLKRRAIFKIEEQIKLEERKIEDKCRQEVLRVINNLANKITWFQTAMLLYKAYPEIFENTKNS